MFKPGIENRPGYHATLRQSVENPAQPERLPKGATLSLEHHTRVASATERRRIYLGLAWSVVWRAALLTIGKFIGSWGFSTNKYFAVLLLLALLSVAHGLFAKRSAVLRWFVYLLVCPLLALPAAVVEVPYYELSLAFLALTLVADRLATHHFYSLSTSLRLRRRRWLRRIWRSRFNLFVSPARSIPFYLLAAAVPLGIFGLILYRRQKPIEFFFFDDFVVLGGALLVAAAVAFVFEPTINFIYGQPIKHPWALVRLAWRSLLDWATYNHFDRTLPGVFISPGGPLRARLHLLLGTGLLSAVPIFELTYTSRLEQIREQDAAQATSVSPEETLQPYQRALVERMSPEEREEYLQNLPTARAPLSAEDDELIGTLHLDGLTTRPSVFTLFALSAPLLSLGAPFLAFMLVFAFLIVATIPAVARADSEARQAGAKDSNSSQLDAVLWGRFVSALQSAPTKLERESFFIGMNAADDSPVIVPRRVFQEHAHYLGDSGSGKSTLGLAPLISQMIQSRDCSVVVIDLKGDDPSLFENARIEAERAGLKFRWFTNELGKATYVFNPLLQRHLRELSLYQRTDLLTASLGLQYGTDYGRGFFSDANAELLYHALRARPHLGSFRELSQVLKEREPFRTVSAQLKMAGSHLAAIVTRLGSTEALNARPGEAASPDGLAASIDMRQAFEEPQIIYFHLASALGTATSAEIARMAMFSLLSAAKFVEGKRKQVFLIVDEFQRAVSNNLELFLQTARSMDIGVILANQSLSDLRKPGVDIVSTVRTNTRYRQLFAVGEMNDLEEVIRTSGETLIHTSGWSEVLGLTLFGAAGAIRSRSIKEEVSPRLRVNDLLLASDHPLQSVCHVRRGDGFAQYGGMPFIIQSTYHISADEYLERKRAAWPVETSETFTPTLSTTDPIAAQAAPDGDSNVSESEAAKNAADRLFKELDDQYHEQVAARRRATGADD